MTTLAIPPKPGTSRIASGYRVLQNGAWFNPSRDRRGKAQKKADRRERMRELNAANEGAQ